MRILIQIQSIPPRTPTQPVEWFGPMPPIGSEMTIVGVKHEVVKHSYDVYYDIAVDSNTTVDPRSEPHYGYMRCTQLTIHLKPKHREPEGSLIASLIGGIGKGQAVKWNEDSSVSRYERGNAVPLVPLAAKRQAVDVDRTGIPDNGITFKQGCSGPSELWFVPLCVNLNCKNQGKCSCKPTIVPIHPQSHE